mmetsp:Transcript_14583/g.40529  ORF Transcript_14583/g.40529 Transcript_14583/m.40529 type:complete len:184 (+) Transcript_14583:409-960(+)|eukprot:CAMPEP_0172360502 /NCGR_PEP_ID=MMETSP1060-20121228/4505_1 /TAXON_ID=37318 /ORGANISM="Pseudo-nitzschia pungens, Strain cf. cingulata" /LENGTH=183 /DNA_ID=CAMNT_0013082509 /DNA_START=308 /DNA_END=859 /DNA_ORIENTATION=-
MSEGGILPWKVQKLKLVPTLSYDSIHKPLKAPKGRRWNYDALNKEWSLIAAEEPEAKSPTGVAVNAVVVDNDAVSSFFEHHITSSDTFQGICLRYKIKPRKLRAANGGFTGENLQLCPSPLKIPRPEPTATVVEGAPALTQDEVLGVLMRECNGIAQTEARAYLMLNDWDLKEALENAREDGF